MVCRHSRRPWGYKDGWHDTQKDPSHMAPALHLCQFRVLLFISTYCILRIIMVILTAIYYYTMSLALRWLELGYVTFWQLSPFISQVAYYYYWTFHKKPQCRWHTSDSVDLVWWWLKGLKFHFTKSLLETAVLSLEAESGSLRPMWPSCMRLTIIPHSAWLQHSLFNTWQAGGEPSLRAK